MAKPKRTPKNTISEFKPSASPVPPDASNLPGGFQTGPIGEMYHEPFPQEVEDTDGGDNIKDDDHVNEESQHRDEDIQHIYGEIDHLGFSIPPRPITKFTPEMLIAQDPRYFISATVSFFIHGYQTRELQGVRRLAEEDLDDIEKGVRRVFDLTDVPDDATIKIHTINRL